MTPIERTAFPRFNKKFSQSELEAFFRLTDNELKQLVGYSRSKKLLLVLALSLKTRQYLGYFIALNLIPHEVISFVSIQLSINFDDNTFKVDKKTLYRLRTQCRQFLNYIPLGNKNKNELTRIINKAAYTMSDPADLINVAIEYLADSNIELPAFSTLDRIARHERHLVHEKLFLGFAGRLSVQEKHSLENLLTIMPNQSFTFFAKMKQAPGPATLTNLRKWVNRLETLIKIIDNKAAFQDMSYTKVRQFASQAKASSISDMRNLTNHEKKITLLGCFVYIVQAETRDELIEMYFKRMRRTKNSAIEKLNSIYVQHKEIEENLLNVLNRILNTAKSNELKTTPLDESVQCIIDSEGGVESLTEQLVMVRAFHKNNYLPLLWQFHASYRSVVLKLISFLSIKSSTQDQRLIQAMNYLLEIKNVRKGVIPATVDISFASQRWQKFVFNGNEFDRKSFELCVLTHLGDALECGDLFVEDSHEYSDYREQLLPWKICEQILEEYCLSIGVENTADSFVAKLKNDLNALSQSVDKSFPENTELSIDPCGKPHLKRQIAKKVSKETNNLKKLVYSKIPERHLLDVIKDVEHWVPYFSEFSPPSGNRNKLRQATKNYIFTVFGFGCNLGTSQTARHAPDLINRQTLRRINAQQVNCLKLEKAIDSIIDEYNRFDLPKFWGKANVAIADGTHMGLRENNLLGEHHFRYKRYGGVAYHHICGDYIALFSHFIACGVWEAVYILDALLKQNTSRSIDTLHADTHGQSEPVFALAYLLGINLYPRMRTWNDVAFYHSDKLVKYEHIDALFKRTIDWKLIQTHWKDMMQVVISIHKGKVLPSMLLRKLNSKNKHNKLYLSFRELGRAIRTMFLLRYISESEFRFSIRSETTKVESYNDFLDWISFGGQIIKSGDPDEQTKQIKYMDLIANSIMLQNVVDLSDILDDLSAKEHEITHELISSMSPYIRNHLKRFGKFDVDVKSKPPQLKPKPIEISDEN